jgi:hydrogenase maturation protease
MNRINKSRKFVLGLGNILNHDEGLGVHALKALEAHIAENFLTLPPNKMEENGTEGLEFLDGGVLGMNLLPWVEDASHLLVLDAVEAHKEPGTLIVLQGDEIQLMGMIKLSDHQVTFQEVLGLAKFRQHLPEKLCLIGIQPMDLSIGVGLSPVVAEAIPLVVKAAKSVLCEWGFISNQSPKKGKPIRV